MTAQLGDNRHHGIHAPGVACATVFRCRRGFLPAGGLRPGDWIVSDGGAELPVAAVVPLVLTAPVTVAAGALGPGQPRATLVLSAGQPILIRSPCLLGLTGQSAGLARIGDLTHLPGVRRTPKTVVEGAVLVLRRFGLPMASGLPIEALPLDLWRGQGDGLGLPPFVRRNLTTAAPSLRWDNARAAYQPRVPRLDAREAFIATARIAPARADAPSSSVRGSARAG